MSASTLFPPRTIACAETEPVVASGVPATVKKEIAGTQAEFWVNMNPVYYPELAIRHRNGIRRIS